MTDKPQEYHDLKSLVESNGWRYLVERLTPKIDNLKETILKVDFSCKMNEKEYTRLDVYKIRLNVLETALYTPDQLIKSFEIKIEDMYETMFPEIEEPTE